MDSFDMTNDGFEKLHAENSMLRAELAALREEREYAVRFVIPSTKISYMIQMGILRVELLQAQVGVKKIRRRIGLYKERASDGMIDASLVERAESIIAEEFKEWDKVIAKQIDEIQSAKARFSSITPSEDIDEIRALYRMLARKMDPEINDDMSDEARTFWPSIHTAYVWNDLFQLKALMMMSEDYPESYEMPFDMQSVRRTNAVLKEKVARARRDLSEARQNPVFEWKKLLDSPEDLLREQTKLRDRISDVRIQQTALSDVLRSIEVGAGTY